MCNLYSMTKSREALVAYTRAMRDRTGNQPPLPDIFPDQMAPVVRTAKDGVREVVTMRWGFPPPPAGKRPVTNVRNLTSSYWRNWLDKPDFRCLVPATSFVEYTDTTPKIAHWSRSALTARSFALPGFGGPGAACAARKMASICSFPSSPPTPTISPGRSTPPRALSS